MPDIEMITVGNYSGLPEAELAQGILDAAGIVSVLVDENVGRMLTWTVVGGFKLQVNQDDAEAAVKLLSSPIAAGNPGRCPNCDSADIALDESASSGNSVSSGTPVEGQRSWECKSCGYCWDMPSET
jgi:hypothetical protein